MTSQHVAPHVTELVAENIKRLRAVRITPDSLVIPIAGGNGAGKTSVLDAMVWALGGKSVADPEPIRRGEDQAVIRLSFGEVVVERTFVRDEEGVTTSALKVMSASGARLASPQRILDELLGSSAIMFDPLAFDRMKPADQVLELQKVAPLPPEIGVLEANTTIAFEQRTDRSRRLRSLEGSLQLHPVKLPTGFNPQDPAWQPAATEQVLARLEAVGRRAAEFAQERHRREQISSQMDLHRQSATQRRQEAERYLTEAADLEARADRLGAQLDTLPELEAVPDPAIIRSELTAIEKRNADLKIFAERWQLEREVKDLQAQQEVLTGTIEGNKLKVAQLTAALPMPIPGLSLAPDGVQFNGLPLQQASAAERLRVALAIAMATEPKIRVLWIRDGSLLDDRSLALVAEMAAARDYQVWIERVDPDAETGILIEDGEVVKVNGVPVLTRDP
jgi:hypothetical protein